MWRRTGRSGNASASRGIRNDFPDNPNETRTSLVTPVWTTPSWTAPSPSSTAEPRASSSKTLPPSIRGISRPSLSSAPTSASSLSRGATIETNSSRDRPGPSLGCKSRLLPVYHLTLLNVERGHNSTIRTEIFNPS